MPITRSTNQTPAPATPCRMALRRSLARPGDSTSEERPGTHGQLGNESAHLSEEACRRPYRNPAVEPKSNRGFRVSTPMAAPGVDAARSDRRDALPQRGGHARRPASARRWPRCDARHRRRGRRRRQRQHRRLARRSRASRRRAGRAGRRPRLRHRTDGRDRRRARAVRHHGRRRRQLRLRRGAEVRRAAARGLRPRAGLPARVGGGRVLPGAMPLLHRWFGNPMFSRIARRWFRAPVHDIYCGLRGFTEDALPAARSALHRDGVRHRDDHQGEPARAHASARCRSRCTPTAARATRRT